MAKVHEFKKGDSILLTNGEYSDFRVIGTFPALKDFVSGDVTEVLKAAKRKATEATGFDVFYLDESEIRTAMQEAGLIGDEIDTKELWVDDGV